MDYYLYEENCYQRLKEEYHKYGQLIFCVDFDDTIYDFHKKGRTYTDVINLLKRWAPYSKVIIFTSNGKDKYDFIKNYLKDNHINYETINENILDNFSGRKVYANVYIDDRGGLPSVYKNLNRLIAEIEEEK